MQFIEVYGQRRSGHHAVISWLIKNFEQHLGYDKVYYINDVLHSRFASGENLNKHLVYQMWKSAPEVIILSYEDAPTTVSRLEDRIDRTKIVVVRDIVNTAASRHQRAITAGTLHRADCHMKMTQEFADIWIEHATHPNIFKYENFLFSKPERDALSRKYNTPNYDITGVVNEYGNGSSFVGQSVDDKKKYLKRHEMVQLPEDVIGLLNQPKVLAIRKLLKYI